MPDLNTRTEKATDFITLALELGALQLGQFTLKSGRSSPYFFNSNAFCTTTAMRALGNLYAEAIMSQKTLQFDTVFGAAYKGIPLLGSVGAILGDRHQTGLNLSYNRKEAKTHGDCGIFGGAPIQGRVLILDDVITAGTAIREAIELITQQDNVTLAGVVVCFDRCEKGLGEQSAATELAQEYAIPIISIATFHTLYAHIENHPKLEGQFLRAFKSYRLQWGIPDTSDC